MARSMTFWQRVGLGFLCLSFALQAVAVTCPKSRGGRLQHRSTRRNDVIIAIMLMNRK